MLSENRAEMKKVERDERKIQSPVRIEILEMAHTILVIKLHPPTAYTICLPELVKNCSLEAAPAGIYSECSQSFAFCSRVV